MSITIESVEQYKELLSSNAMVLVDYHAKWCKPCIQLAPYIEQIAQKYPNLKVLKVDYDVLDEIIDAEGIEKLPSIKTFHNGKVIKVTVGASLPIIDDQLDELLKLGGAATADPQQHQQQPQQQQQQQHQASRRGQTTSLSQSNSGIRQPTTQPQSHLQQTNPANPFGRLESNSNQVVPTSNPTNKPKSNPAPQLDMDFESFFQDDQPKANGSANQSQQSQMGSPLADLFSPSGTTTNTANNSVNATPQSAPAPHVSGNDPFALLSQPGIVEQPKDKKTDSILSLYNNPTPQQHPPHLQNNNGMQSPYGNQPQQQQHQQFSQNYGQQLQHHQQQQQQQHYANPQMGQMNMMGSPYGYAQPNQMMYGQPMPMHMNANPYAQPQMQHPNSNVAFGGTYSYAAPAQSGLQKQNNNTSSGQNFDVFAGFM